MQEKVYPPHLSLPMHVHFSRYYVLRVYPPHPGHIVNGDSPFL